MKNKCQPSPFGHNRHVRTKWTRKKEVDNPITPVHLAMRGQKTKFTESVLSPVRRKQKLVFLRKTGAIKNNTNPQHFAGILENLQLGAVMGTLTEQVTFKVSRETLAALRERGNAHGLDANPFARKLVEEGLESERHEMLADELRELLGLLRPVASQLEAFRDSHSAAVDGKLAEEQLSQITDGVSQAATLTAQDMSSLKAAVAEQLQPIQSLFDQVFELRADLNKTFAALLHYRMDFSIEEAQGWVDARLNAKKG